MMPLKINTILILSFFLFLFDFISVSFTQPLSFFFSSLSLPFPLVSLHQLFILVACLLHITCCLFLSISSFHLLTFFFSFFSSSFSSFFSWLSNLSIKSFPPAAQTVTVNTHFITLLHPIHTHSILLLPLSFKSFNSLFSSQTIPKNERKEEFERERKNLREKLRI